MAREIKKSNLYDMRRQLNDTVMKWPEVKEVVEETEECWVPGDSQLLLYEEITVSGIVRLDGKMVLL